MNIEYETLGFEQFYTVQTDIGKEYIKVSDLGNESRFMDENGLVYPDKLQNFLRGKPLFPNISVWPSAYIKVLVKTRLQWGVPGPQYFSTEDDAADFIRRCEAEYRSWKRHDLYNS